MENILLLFLCLFAGLGLQKCKAFGANSASVLNQFIIYISLPALALRHIPHIRLGLDLLYPLGVAWLGFALSFLFFEGLSRRLGWSRKLTGCLILMGGLGNTSFVGFPIVEALYGKEGLQTAIIVDQPGSFMVMATLGILVAARYAKNAGNGESVWRKILLFPPFIGFAIALVLNIFGTTFPVMVEGVLEKLGATVTPIAMVAVGLQLKIDKRSKHWGFLALGLFFKLMLTPAFFYVLYRYVLGQRGLHLDVSIIEAAMAPMITASVLASNYGLKPRLSGMMIGIGIPLSFLTVAFWYWVL